MHKLPETLNKFPSIQNAIYADGITIWTNTGLDGEKQEALQTAATAAQKHALQCVLQCSVVKSELLCILKRTPGKTYVPPTPMTINLDWKPIPTVKTLKVLGMKVHQESDRGAALKHLLKQIEQTL
ncbi:hypothetical protein HPB48_007749 [Haemaphysalis longicornis]|uniref:Uncharacterized protein n=1 Tax=Haemaphysalis longicornis TaxID=44386 RepID=A0A9J6FUZ9_HAELO|nr:hypothetical protein HPB48_007749 [Haemaphysalis longicornis]